MNNWLLDILDTHKRTRGLSLSQLKELIDQLDVSALREIKQRLEQRWFKNVLIEANADELIERCEGRAREILWERYAEDLKKDFMHRVVDPFGDIV